MTIKLLLLASVALVVLGYAALCALLYFTQRSIVYFPQYTHVDPAATDFSLVHDGVTLRGWVLDREGRDPILYFGGNAEPIEGNRADFARWFPGRAVYLVAYRGYGASEGRPSEQALLDDALAIYDHVQSRHPGQPIAAIGRSLGAGVASWLASQRPIAKLALVTPFDSLAAVGQSHYPWLPVRWLAKDRYESAQHLRRYAGPVLVIRAGRDRIIPPEHTDRLIASLPAPPRVVNLPDADHNSIGNDPAYGEALSGFMR